MRVTTRAIAWRKLEGVMGDIDAHHVNLKEMC